LERASSNSCFTFPASEGPAGLSILAKWELGTCTCRGCSSHSVTWPSPPCVCIPILILLLSAVSSRPACHQWHRCPLTSAPRERDGGPDSGLPSHCPNTAKVAPPCPMGHGLFRALISQHVTGLTQSQERSRCQTSSTWGMWAF
jgi:hypothetical protein